MKNITYEHDCLYYVPVYQKNTDENGNKLDTPTLFIQWQMLNKMSK